MITGRTAYERRVQRLQDVLVKARREDGLRQIAESRLLRQQLEDAFRIQRFAALVALDTENPIAGTENVIVLPIQEAQRMGYLLGQERTIARLLKRTGAMETKDVLESRYRALVTQYLATVGAARINGINDRTTKRIREIVEATEREKVAALLYDQGEHGVFSPFRAAIVAHTEVGHAHETGKYETALLLGARLNLRQYKAWQTSGNDRVCPSCQTAEADGFIPIEQQFSNGFDAPLAHPSCACTLVYDLRS